MPDYFEDIKNYLDITFEDEGTNAKLGRACNRAEAYLQRRLGKKIVFSVSMEDSYMLQILFDCVRYIWSDAFDEFDKNYFNELEGLRNNIHAETIEDVDDEE